MVLLREYLQKERERVRQIMEAACAALACACAHARSSLREESAQGTTEYAILVGVLVVIAILAIIAFRERVSGLWNEIETGINSL